MLGQIPEYLEAAARSGARVFNIPAEIYRTLSPAAQWAANQKFLDRAIARGVNILLATDPTKIRVGSTLEREVKYLLERGYKIIGDKAAGVPWKIVKI
jgi:hypothetical protein